MRPQGRPLELALARGARHYRSAGRKVVLIKQHVPMVPGGPRGELIESSTGAPVDLIGGVDGRPWALEAKMTGDPSFHLEARRESQRATLSMMQSCDFVVGLVLEFTRVGEVYLCPWDAVSWFETAGWRKSLSLDWCRANGLLLPELERGSTSARKTLFLDGAAHPAREEAIAAVAADQSRAMAAAKQREALENAGTVAPVAPARASKRQLELQARTASRPHPRDKEAYRVWLRGQIGESVDRQVDALIRDRKRTRAPRRPNQ